jgi:hypothetical protein
MFIHLRRARAGRKLAWSSVALQVLMKADIKVKVYKWSKQTLAGGQFLRLRGVSGIRRQKYSLYIVYLFEIEGHVC